MSQDPISRPMLIAFDAIEDGALAETILVTEEAGRRRGKADALALESLERVHLPGERGVSFVGARVSQGPSPDV